MHVVYLILGNDLKSVNLGAKHNVTVVQKLSISYCASHELWSSLQYDGGLFVAMNVILKDACNILPNNKFLKSLDDSNPLSLSSSSSFIMDLSCLGRTDRERSAKRHCTYIKLSCGLRDIEHM